MRNDSSERAGVEDRIRSLGVGAFPLPEAELCGECGDGACPHVSALYSGGTEPPCPSMIPFTQP